MHLEIMRSISEAPLLSQSLLDLEIGVDDRIVAVEARGHRIGHCRWKCIRVEMLRERWSVLLGISFRLRRDYENGLR